MDWILNGYSGAGPLKLGMSPEQAQSVAGKPFKTHVSKTTGMLFEWRDTDRPDLSYANNRLQEISFTPEVKNVSYNDIAVFEVSQSEFLRHIEANETRFYKTFGMLIAYDLGLFLHGFHDEEPRRVGLFVKDTWDYMLEDAEPFAV